tara:strand:+ start:140 stop:490 length:351 start_codon:yes stop_codon:yes gene_type:complete
MKQQILRDALIGGIFVGIFSYFASIYDSHPSYLNITAYLWGIPLTYFFLVYITWQKNRDAMFSFTRHAIVGTALTLLVMLITLYMKNYSLTTIIVTNVALLLLFIAVYFYFELYKL